MEKKELIKTAKDATKSAYSPYSHFRVGAALLCEDGTVYTGCNIENSSFGVTCCAERVALFKAVSDGKRCFTDIAIVGSSTDKFDKPCAPCGVCRQALSEFCKGDFKIHLCNSDEIITYTLDDILPHSFKLDQKGN